MPLKAWRCPVGLLHPHNPGAKHERLWPPSGALPRLPQDAAPTCPDRHLHEPRPAGGLVRWSDALPDADLTLCRARTGRL